MLRDLSATMIKNPFIVHRDILSPLECESIVSSAYQLSDGDDLHTEHLNDTDISEIILQQITPRINAHYKTTIVEEVVSSVTMSKSYIPNIRCESTVKHNGMWFRNKDIDFCTVVFLKDHLSSSLEVIDLSYEIYGGNLEFPTFPLSFTPTRGTAVTYPCVPNFVNTFSKINLGEQNVLHITHRADIMFAYQPTDFKGNFSDWFKDI